MYKIETIRRQSISEGFEFGEEALIPRTHTPRGTHWKRIRGMRRFLSFVVFGKNCYNWGVGGGLFYIIVSEITGTYEWSS